MKFRYKIYWKLRQWYGHWNWTFYYKKWHNWKNIIKIMTEHPDKVLKRIHKKEVPEVAKL